MKYSLLLTLLFFSTVAFGQWPIFVHNENNVPPSFIVDKMIQTQDGGFLVAMTARDSFPNMDISLLAPYLKKYDAEGNLMWEKKYYHWETEGDSTYQVRMSGRDLIEKPNGELLLCGDYSNTLDFINFTLTLSSEGDSILHTTQYDYKIFKMYVKDAIVYFRGSYNVEYSIMGILQENGSIQELINHEEISGANDYLISDDEIIYHLDGVSDTRIKKFNFDNELIESRFFQGKKAAGKILMNDFNQIICYERDFLVLDENLDSLLYYPSSFFSSANLKGRDMKSTADGGYILSGFVSSSSIAFDRVFLIKMSNGFDVEWGFIYGEFPLNVSFQVEETADGYVFLAGEETDGDIWLVKMDIDGEIVSTSEAGAPIEKSTLMAFPNPVENELNITGLARQSGRLELFSLNGEVLKKGHLKNGQAIIEVSDLAAGIYFIRFFNDKTEQLEILKIIKI